MKKQLTLNVNGQEHQVEVGEGDTMKTMRAKWARPTLAEQSNT